MLREIDLYSFQGLLKSEVKARHPAQQRDWKGRPEAFELDGHAPCREMWHRGSLAWRSLLLQGREEEDGGAGKAPVSPKETTDVGRVLVVAHNNMNQALIATALGLPVTYFRRLVQSNAAASCLLIRPKPGQESPEVRT